VCPTGALTVKSETAEVFAALADDRTAVVAQIAPAVRVALGEAYGIAAGTVTTGQIAAALKALGFDRVYDTAFGADLTVLEETHEFLERKTKGTGPLPHLTSCCPGAEPGATLFAWLRELLGPQMVRVIHHLAMWLILAIAFFHVYSCILVDHIENVGVVTSMFTGYKFPFREEVVESRDGGLDVLAEAERLAHG
jgi:hypothetical protein